MLYYAIALDMKIALIGYGRMGKIVEKLIEDSGEHEIVLIVDPLLPTGMLEAGMLTEADVAIAVMIFLNRACNDAASAFLEAGRVWNDKAVIGTNAIGTPIHNKRFGNITLSIEDVVFNCVSINKETDIVKSPAVAMIFGFIYLESSPNSNNPTRQTIERGNIESPDFEGLYPKRLWTNIGTKSRVEYIVTLINELINVPNIKFLSLNTLISITGYLYSSSHT